MGSVSNPPLLITANWLSHLELDWDAPFWMPLFRDLAKNFHIVRYDGRGYGVSTWDAPDIGLDAFVADLRTVADAAGLERFALLGISPGAAVSIEFAARHPERVSHLILCGSYVAGWRHIESAEEAREREAILLLAEAGWARNNRTYRTLFSHGFLPNATAAEKRWFDDFQRRTTSAKNAMRLLDAFTSFDVRERLPQLTTPTLVIHSRGDTRVPVATARETAKQIPGAELLELASNNHLLLGREPAAADFLRAVRRFLK
jgi:pimeloyl-ACP methyl ester carboxylesterase